VKLKIAGGGETEYFINKAKQLKIENCVEFLGLVPNKDVVHLMREADLVLIPSRHEYPEGFPMTIYEGLCSRTPLIVSDHPMFQGNLKHGINAVIFPAGKSTTLSESIEQLLSDPELYKSLSVASYEAWQRLQIPVKWAEMIERWLDNSPENQHWLFDHRLSSGRYNSILEQ
jgi:glycosyltransferase involved in cell wall biosynthesis